MKILLDANLSWRLVEKLRIHFREVQHVKNIPFLYPSSDTAIWNYARENNYIIVSNDEDFLHLLLKKGFPPKVILLKTGNQSNKYLFDLLVKHTSDIEALYTTVEYGLLEIFD